MTKPASIPASIPSVWGIHDSQQPPDPRPSGCGFFRIVLPLDQLRAHGWRADYANGTPPPEAANYAVMVGERLDRPEVLGPWRRATLKHKVVYELDDDVWHVGQHNWMAFQSYGRNSVMDAVAMCCRVSHMVTVTTEPLAQEVRRWSGNTNVRVIPNYIPESLLSLERPRREHVTIGWMGGASHTLDLAQIATPVRRVMEDTSLRLHLIGSDFRPTLGMIRSRFTNWEVHPPDLYQHMDFDIGLAPLDPSQFNESKCVDSGMRVSTDRGVLEAGALEAGMKVWRDGWRKIEAVERSPARQGVLITTAGGYQLRLTPEHRMLVNGDWLRAGSIKAGDILAMEPDAAGPKDFVRAREVLAVEPCTVEPVDIQVEGGTFVLAGFVSHNSHLKALEYSALGIPVIASDFGPYRDFVVDGVTGFLVRKEKEWRDRMRLLVADADLRESMGAKARELAGAHTIEGNWWRWAAAYESLL